MDHTTTNRRPPARTGSSDPEELLSRIEGLQRRIASLAAARRADDVQTRRQRAAGRRP